MTRHTANDELPEAAGTYSHVADISSLGDGRRRALYRYVVAQTGPVNRDEAALGAGVARHVAKFHLDKLVEHGLLSVEYARPAGRGGPGAGRPAKLYRRSSSQLSVSLPPRDYVLVGRLLASAVTDAQHGASLSEALHDSARTAGRSLGQRSRRRVASRSTPDSAGELSGAHEVLDRLGYEPRFDGEELSLANCPFRDLAQDYTELICGMNVDLMTGLLEGLELAGLEAHLEPSVGRCCVRIRSNNHRSANPRISKEE